VGDSLLASHNNMNNMILNVIRVVHGIEICIIEDSSPITNVSTLLNRPVRHHGYNLEL